MEMNQAKTGTPLRLHLTNEVGEALIDYSNSGGPQTTHREVFLKVVPPFDPLTVYGGAQLPALPGEPLSLVTINKVLSLKCRWSRAFKIWPRNRACHRGSTPYFEGKRSTPRRSGLSCT
jgi:hypothetical protein